MLNASRKPEFVHLNVFSLAIGCAILLLHACLVGWEVLWSFTSTRTFITIGDV
jgi:hypothetical protein